MKSRVLVLGLLAIFSSAETFASTCGHVLAGFDVYWEKVVVEMRELPSESAGETEDRKFYTATSFGTSEQIIVMLSKHGLVLFNAKAKAVSPYLTSRHRLTCFKAGQNLFSLEDGRILNLYIDEYEGSVSSVTYRVYPRVFLPEEILNDSIKRYAKEIQNLLDSGEIEAADLDGIKIIRGKSEVTGFSVDVLETGTGKHFFFSPWTKKQRRHLDTRGWWRRHFFSARYDLIKLQDGRRMRAWRANENSGESDEYEFVLE